MIFTMILHIHFTEHWTCWMFNMCSWLLLLVCCTKYALLKWKASYTQCIQILDHDIEHMIGSTSSYFSSMVVYSADKFQHIQTELIKLYILNSILHGKLCNNCNYGKWSHHRVLASISKLAVQPSGDSKTTCPTRSGNQYSMRQQQL